MDTAHHHRHHYHDYQAPFHYAILVLLVGTAFLTFIQHVGQPSKQLVVSFLTALTYVGWGIFHHAHVGDLNWRIVVEYSAFATVGFTLLWSALIMLG
jgi:hypothetical protein